MEISQHRGEYYRASDGWRFRIKGLNGEIIANGESYEDVDDCIETLQSLLGPRDPIVEVEQ